MNWTVLDCGCAYLFHVCQQLTQGSHFGTAGSVHWKTSLYLSLIIQYSIISDKHCVNETELSPLSFQQWYWPSTGDGPWPWVRCLFFPQHTLHSLLSVLLFCLWRLLRLRALPTCVSVTHMPSVWSLCPSDLMEMRDAQVSKSKFRVWDIQIIG